MRSRIGANRTAWAAVFLLAGAAGLFLYLWAALRGPVVVWSDSRIDLALARERLGFLGGAAYRDTGGWGHAVKPGYVFFLTLCTAVFRDPARASVVVQSIVLFAAIAGVALFAAKRRSAAHGAAFLVLALATLSFRDAASAVMSEALATAGFLAIAAWAALGRRVGIGRALLAGIAVAVLFFVRPNVGVAAGVLVLLGFRGVRLRRPVLAAAVAAGFLAVVVPVGLARRAHAPEPGRSGMSSAILTGSLDYLWPPSAGRWPSAATPNETARQEIRLAIARWKATWPPSTPEIRRQWIWRAFH
ncbi:MAG TPA: hypothetical protein VG777_05640, partial [Thermoanaerobaculia bacterium]|nr:hypothetical protein [Thermoanaerobaculia bacterium]